MDTCSLPLNIRRAIKDSALMNINGRSSDDFDSNYYDNSIGRILDTKENNCRHQEKTYFEKDESADEALEPTL